MITTYIYVDNWKLYQDLCSSALADGWTDFLLTYDSNKWVCRKFDRVGTGNSLVIKAVCKDTEEHKQISLDHHILP